MEENKATVETNSPPKWSHFSDERLRTMFYKEARDKCRTECEEFFKCSKENGFLVVINCREQNKRQNDCTKQYTTQPQWSEYRKQKIAEYAASGKIQAPKELKEEILHR